MPNDSGEVVYGSIVFLETVIRGLLNRKDIFLRDSVYWKLIGMMHRCGLQVSYRSPCNRTVDSRYVAQKSKTCVIASFASFLPLTCFYARVLSEMNSVLSTTLA